MENILPKTDTSWNKTNEPVLEQEALYGICATIR